LGAQRTYLGRRLLTESLVLAVLSGVIGILSAYWAIPIMNNLLSCHADLLQSGLV
jgi:ABC-type antimicrobial peptide transport system permease subunit